MGTNNNSAKPWLDHRGRELPTEQLREISKNWDLKKWKPYGDSLEVQPEVTDFFRNVPANFIKVYQSISCKCAT